MKIDEQFNLVAREYDENRRRFIPCFDEFYEGATNFVTSSITYPKRMLDLGAGTGLLTAYWYARFPQIEYVLVDVAEQMLDVAKERFQNLNNVSYNVLDYAKELPSTECDIIASALSIHHLEHTQKQDLFRRIYDKLPNGGTFVNHDQFCGDSREISELYDRYWIERLERSGLSDQDLSRWRTRRALDRECSVSDETKWLKEAGFRTVQCIYSNQKFSVLMAIK